MPSVKTNNNHPPRVAKQLLFWMLRTDLAEEVSGDLEEKFLSMTIKKTKLRAQLNYWFEVMNYVRPFALKRFKRRRSNHYSMYQSYFKIGWRNLVKNKGYSLINIGGLAIGMTVAMLIGLWIHDELSFNRYHENYSTIAQVKRTEVWNNETHVNTALVTGVGTLLKNEYKDYFDRVVMVYSGRPDIVLASKEKKFTQPGYFMQAEGPEMFTLKMKYGTRNGLQDMNAIMLSESLAIKLFGDTDPVNETVTMDASRELKITGVFEDLPKNSLFSEATYFAPLDLYLDGWASLTAWDNYNMEIYVQTKPGADVTKITSVIKDAMIPHVRKEVADAKPGLFLQPMHEWHLYSQYENGHAVTSEQLKFVWFYGLIGVFVLLLACINFMNLSTARSEKRAREVGIRKSIGSLRSQLIHQFFGESLLVTAISFVFALLLVVSALQWFNGITDKDMSMPWTNWMFWLACITFTLLTGFLAGSYPALYLSSFNPVKVLKGTFKAGRFSSLPRRVLVVIQFTVSVSLVIGTLVVYQQIQFVKDRPVGYSRNGLIELQPRSPEYKGKYEVLRNEFIRTGAVEDIAVSNYPVTNNLGWNNGWVWRGRPQGFDPSFNVNSVSPEYGKTMGLEFVAGRDFSRETPGDEWAMIINESALKVMKLDNPIGELVPRIPEGNDRGTYKIIGVVKDMVKKSPYEPSDPCIILMSKGDLDWLYVRLKSSVSASEALPKIQSAFTAIVPSAPFDYKFIDDAYDAKFRSEERVGKVAGILSFFAILISCSGLFGLASFVAEQRTKEISIRKILGASVSNLWQLLSKEFVILVIIACFVAVPLSFSFMKNWLLQYDYRTTISWQLFAITILGAFAITLVTVSFQALRTAFSNPVDSLKSE